MALESVDLVPGFAFWRDGCRTFAKNVYMLLHLVEKEIEEEHVLRLLITLPRVPSALSLPEWEEGYCNQCLKKAFSVSPKVAVSLNEYFLGYFPKRGRTAQAMLIDAFVGIMAGAQEAFDELESEQESQTPQSPDADVATQRPAV